MMLVKGFSTMARRNTIEDVAKLAGVSKVTVSYVLNGRGGSARISAGTEERVVRAAQALGYRPNALARMLVTRRSDMIAVVFQKGEYFSAASSFTSEVMRGVCDACTEAGLDLVLHTKRVEVEVEASALMDGRVDGILVLRDVNDPAIEEVLAHKFPCVLFFSRSDEAEVPFVDADNFAGGKIATQHLLDLGHRRIGMVRGPKLSVAANDRYAGYRHSLEQRGLDVDLGLIAQMDSPKDRPASLIALLDQAQPPTAIFCWSDEVAFVAMRMARELGLSIPEQLSIVGFDSTPACDRTTPALTSVHQPVFLMARDAAMLLASILRDEPIERRQVIYPLTLDVRGSTAAPSP
jgi:DNA-binding LacI/PurR family transcriptional regulator